MTRRSVSGLTWKDWWHKNVKKQKGILLCDRCNAVFYDGHWHTDPYASVALKEAKPGSSSKPSLCPQCVYVMNGEGKSDADFEGQLTLDGLHDAKEKDEILRLIRNEARKSEKNDPEDQVIMIDDKDDRVIITTTDNQLAVRLGKMVDEAHKGGTLRISWSEDDLPVRVYWKHKLTRH